MSSPDCGQPDILRAERLKFQAMQIAAIVTAAALACTYGWGCISQFTSGLGATPGGQQDIASARDTIERGGVPDPASITVEGFLSEHSIPMEPPANPGVVFANASTAWNRDFRSFTPTATVQIGFGTMVDAEAFQRTDLNLCLAIDRSGSMADLLDAQSDTTKLDAVKIAVDRLLGQLTAADRVNVVTFNTAAQTRLESVAGNNIAAIKTALDDVTATGGTDLATGLRRAHEVAARNAGGSRSARVLLFTDAELLRRNEDRVRRFLDVMREFAADGIGTTVFGVGTDFGHEVAYDIAQIEGGNYFFLSDYDRIVTIFDVEFDYFVTPIAYDVTLGVSVPFEFDVVGVYGVPYEGPFSHSLALKLPTLFLSNRQGGGAVFVRSRAGALTDFSEAQPAATIKLSYRTGAGVAMTQSTIIAALPPSLDATAARTYFQNNATKRGVLLLNTALTLRAACEDVYSNGYYYSYDTEARTRAAARLTEFLVFFDEMAAGLDDQSAPESRALSQERALLEKLRTNLQLG